MDNYMRQEALLNPINVRDRKVYVIGAGATGSYVAHMLDKMGFSNIKVYDDDVIEEHNICNQLYTEEQIGKKKVLALKELVPSISAVPTKMVGLQTALICNDIVICCVDDMEARKDIYEYAYKRGKASIYIEPRLGMWGGFVYSLFRADDEDLEKYEKTLYTNGESEVSACGQSQTVLPSVMNLASLVVMQLCCILNEQPGADVIKFCIPDMVAETEMMRND